MDLEVIWKQEAIASPKALQSTYQEFLRLNPDMLQIASKAGNKKILVQTLSRRGSERAFQAGVKYLTYSNHISERLC
jgi:hypothetical protein